MTWTRVAGLVVVIAVGAVALALAVTQDGGSKPGRASGPFALLRPASPSSGWNVAVTQAGAALAYSPGWMPIKTDPGTVSVALLASGGRIDGYLNATPGRYMTSKAGYREIAFLVSGPSSSAVVVAAAERHVQPAGGHLGASRVELSRVSGRPRGTVSNQQIYDLPGG